MKQRFFITSSGTGIGKTLVTASLCHQLRGQGKTVNALKPIISGWNESDEESDTAILLRSLGRPFNAKSIECISPWRFHAPLSPDMAAREEGDSIDFSALTAFCAQPDEAEYSFIEGVGGVMVPLTDRHTVLDLMEVLKFPVILVVGSYLGSLSHTLTALEALRSRGLEVRAIVISESESSTVPLAEIYKTLHNFTRIPMITLPRVASGDMPLWMRTPDITSLIRGGE